MARMTRVRLYMDCQRGLVAARPRSIGVLPEPHWCPSIDELSPSHYTGLRAQFSFSCDLMAGRRRFICCLIEDYLVLFDRVESFPPQESWCGHQGSHQIISHFLLVDLLWFYCDFLFYGIIFFPIWVFPFWCISEVFLNKTPWKVYGTWFWNKNYFKKYYSHA